MKRLTQHRGSPQRSPLLHPRRPPPRSRRVASVVRLRAERRSSDPLQRSTRLHQTRRRAKQNRVLAALVRGGTILRSPALDVRARCVEASHSDPATRTAIVSKPGSEVRGTVGQPEVVINGETRPLDVPPESRQHHGAVVVPVRVLSVLLMGAIRPVGFRTSASSSCASLAAPGVPTAPPAPPPPPL